MDFFLRPPHTAGTVTAVTGAASWAIRLMAFALVAVASSRADLRTRRVPRLPLLALLGLLVPGSALGQDPGLCSSAAGALAGLLVFGSVRSFTGGRLGLADVWMAACIGALGGTGLLLSATGLAVLLLVPQIVPARGSRERPLPFIPALSAATFFSVALRFFGQHSVSP